MNTLFYSYFYLIVALIGLISCQETNEIKPDPVSIDDSLSEFRAERMHMEEIEYQDSIIENPLYSKDLQVIDSLDLAYQIIFNSKTHEVEIKFFKKLFNNWEYSYSLDSIFSQFGVPSLQFMDFNFDGVLDARLPIGAGARGANELFEVFLFDDETRKFIKLKSKRLPPNLYPNKKSQKVEATVFYGRTRFEEYIIVGDSLILEKGIEVWSEDEWTFRDIKFYDITGTNTKCVIDSIKDFGEGTFSPEFIN